MEGGLPAITRMRVSERERGSFSISGDGADPSYSPILKAAAPVRKAMITRRLMIGFSLMDIANDDTVVL